MAIQKETPFTAYDFSDEEIQHAMVFNATQKQYLQTLLSMVAMDKLAEAFDGSNPTQFAQREAYSRGQMDLLNTLLAERVFDSEENPYDPKEEVPAATSDKPSAPQT